MFQSSGLKTIMLPHALRVIGESAFTECKGLEQVVFGDKSELEEIGTKAFFQCGLRSFAAPPRLQKIGALAFSGCLRLSDFRLNQGIQELGWLCFLTTAVQQIDVPPQVGKTLEQLGVGQSIQKVLRLPDGLEVVGREWFEESDMSKVIVSSSVRELGVNAFRGCMELRELVFEPGTRLERICNSCFCCCGFKKLVSPRSVRVIE